MDMYIFLQHYWWFIVSLLGALLVFLMFIQGGNSLLFQIGKTEQERDMLVLLTGRKWEFTFTTLVTFGGAFFASFPLFYSTSFGGAYWAWMLLLFTFILQAVSYEFQNKLGNLLGKRTYQFFLVLNGILAPLLVGVVVGTFFTGSDFVIDKSNFANLGMPVISVWKNPAHGLEALLVPLNVILGLCILFLSRILGSLYYISRTNEDFVQVRGRKTLWIDSVLFLLTFLTSVILILTKKGYAVVDAMVVMEPYKYFHNFMECGGVLLVVFLAGVLLVLTGLLRTLFSKSFTGGIWPTGIGVILTVLSLLMNVGFFNTAYYPSNIDLQSSLTISNSCSSFFTLKTMAFVSILIPFVLLYIVYAWRSLENKKEKMGEKIENR